MDKSLYKFLLETKAELLIRKRKMETQEFEKDVALGNVIYAVDEVVKKLEAEDKGEDL